jgi:CRP-like cAMP-binding protein
MSWPTEDASTRHLVRHPWRAYAVCVILSDMSDRLLAAARRFRRAERAYEQAREELAEAIVGAALDEGMRQVDIVDATGYTREHIRRIVDEARRKRMQAAQS